MLYGGVPRATCGKIIRELEMVLLEISNLSKRFGGLAALDKIDLYISESEIRGIIGPNGAGKTTLFNVISGFFRPTEGNVIFKGEDITRLPIHSRVRKGIARTFQLTNLFMDSTVYENVNIGYHNNYKVGLLGKILHTSAARKEEDICNQSTMEILEFIGLGRLRAEVARNLPYGHQRILGVSIAFAARPSLLMLDEPVAGMNPEETTSMVELIRKIRDRGVTILIVEHNMKAIMDLCERISVLNYGKKIAEGSPGDIRKDKKVIEAYLGSWEETIHHA